MNKKKYIRPEVNQIKLDYSISLIMASTIPPKPTPRSGSNPQQQDPFASPFGDKHTN